MYQTQSGAEYEGKRSFANRGLMLLPAAIPSRTAPMAQIPIENRSAAVTVMANLLVKRRLLQNSLGASTSYNHPPVEARRKRMGQALKARHLRVQSANWLGATFTSGHKISRFQRLLNFFSYPARLGWAITLRAFGAVPELRRRL